LIALVFIILCYLIGAIPFGLIVVKWLKGVDIRELGSGNIGATNVARAAGRNIAVLVFILDFFKGFLPVIIILTFVDGYGAGSFVPVLTGLATVLGHMFPVYLKFKGGKGVATGAGMLGALVPLALGVAFIVWVLVVGVSRYISLGSMSAAVALPISYIIIEHKEAFGKNWVLTVFCIVVAALVIVRHRHNIKRLLAGTENRIGAKPAGGEEDEE
jgi:glycerol-3-phosphate acyltransferase PlsY